MEYRDLLLRVLIYGVIIGVIIFYFYFQRSRAQRSYLREFTENFNALGQLLHKPKLSHDEEAACIAYFLVAYRFFEGVVLPKYLDGLYPETTQSARLWEVTALQLRELLSEQLISQQQADVLLAMKKSVLMFETARWPGVSYHEQEFFDESCKKIRVYYETMHEILTQLEHL